MIMCYTFSSSSNIRVRLVFGMQKSRLSALESLRTSNSRCIVVASDVAARGLDIPSVTTVVHYDVARAVDTFIHRSGRTAVSTQEKCILLAIIMLSFEPMTMMTYIETKSHF